MYINFRVKYIEIILKVETLNKLKSGLVLCKYNTMEEVGDNWNMVELKYIPIIYLWSFPKAGGLDSYGDEILGTRRFNEIKPDLCFHLGKLMGMKHWSV